MDDYKQGQTAYKRILLTMPYYYRRKKKKPKSDDSAPKKRVKKPVNLVAKLDREFALYIRLRDAMPSGLFRCISCGQIKPFEQSDCGHYHSRTHMATRWNEANCNAECHYCNRFSADHLIGYRENLIRKIGQSRFDLLQVMARSSRKWSDFELKLMIEHYHREVVRLSIQKGIKVKF